MINLRFTTLGPTGHPQDTADATSATRARHDLDGKINQPAKMIYGIQGVDPG